MANQTSSSKHKLIVAGNIWNLCKIIIEINLSVLKQKIKVEWAYFVYNLHPVSILKCQDK